MKIVIPYTPRFPQTVIHEQLESHRFAVLVAHRRMGKTVLAVNELIKTGYLVKTPHEKIKEYYLFYENGIDD